jgi:penicillin-binding protein 1A
MKPVNYLIVLFAIALLAVISVVMYVRSVISSDMPSLEQLRNPEQNVASEVISSDGKVIDNFYIQRRISLPYDSIPKHFINALIASEDRAFWDHWGVHSSRVIKALVKNVMAGRIREGASTITMQLARNMFLNQENTLTRKLREAATAVQIEKAYTKEDILKMYSNTILFGRGAYGIQVAARTYFGKNANQLSISECAMLVGILPRPARYNPINNYDLAIVRRNLVLGLMHEQGFINSAEYDDALNENLVITDSNDNPNNDYKINESIAPHFVEMLRQELTESPELKNYDIYRDGLRINTTLNSKIQRYANEAAKEHLEELQVTFDKNWNWRYHQDLLKDIISESIRKHPEYIKAEKSEKNKIAAELRKNTRFIDSVKNLATTIQVSVVVIDPFSGNILAMVGASPKFMEEFSESKYSLNHATQIRRQPGSSFKPFIYAQVLRNGFTPDDTVQCGPFEYELITGDIWSPGGTGDCEEGEYVSLYTGLRRSINTVSARLITGPTNPHEVIALVRKMGIKTSFMAVPYQKDNKIGDMNLVKQSSPTVYFRRGRLKYHQKQCSSC